MKKIISFFLICISTVSFAQRITQEHKDRAADLVRQMTLEEKIAYIGGSEDGFYIRPVERLGIPLIRMADGPQGVRNNTKSTLFASGVAAAASWNRELVYEMGVALGQDSRARGVHILLGPGVNIARNPQCGRNFEYFGEDPYLASETAVEYIRGVQSQDVMATVKHFALNNQEGDRIHLSSDADERTINEIYFPAFRAAVERADVASVMTAYSLLNNVHTAENSWLIRDNLKDGWGFEGFVMSDWTSTYSPLGCVKGGLDLEMPHGFCMKYEHLKPMIDNGVILESEIDEKVRNILQSLIAYGFLDRPQLDTTVKEDNPYSRDVAYRLACESVVMLKNDGVLPLKPGRRNTTVVMGPRSQVIPCGGGSGSVEPLYSISLYEGMLSLGSKWPVMLIDTEGDYSSTENVRALEHASAVVVSVGYDRTTEKENSDRSFQLPEGQDELIEFALRHNDNVIVVVYAGGSVDMSKWKDRVSAILMGWYPGQEGGLAIARMLSGEISPSGRLPMTFEQHLEDNPSSANYFAGPALTKRGLTNRYVTYKEGVFVGYRGYERSGIKPSYPFGYGLTYSSFEYSDLSVVPAGDGFDVSCTVTNTGVREAAEVAQIYVGEQNPSVLRPAKELKGYMKVPLAKGASERIVVHLPEDAFAFYDVNIHDWKVNPGKFNIYVGASAEDIRLETQVSVGQSGDELKVMSYNIRVISQKDGGNQWQYRAAASPAMILDCTPDIFGLQEALPEQVKYMADALDGYSHIGVGRDDGVSKGEHMSIFYNNATVELEDWGTYWLSETPDVPSKGWDAAYKRTATWALMTMKESGKKFFYVNTHLDHSGREAQRRGLDLIVHKIAEMNREGLPMVLTGDFNVEPDNPVLDELDSRMSSARISAEITDNIGTYNGWGTRALVIDYIYHSGFSSCKEYRTIVKQYEGVPYVSDHYPIMSHLVF